MTITDTQSPLDTVTLVIPNGANINAVGVDLNGGTLCGIQIPAAMTGTSFTFQMATTQGGTYQDVFDGSNTIITKTFTQGKYMTLSPADFAGIRFLKVKSSASEGADRTLQLQVRPV